MPVRKIYRKCQTRQQIPDNMTSMTASRIAPLYKKFHNQRILTSHERLTGVLTYPVEEGLMT